LYNLLLDQKQQHIQRYTNASPNYVVGDIIDACAARRNKTTHVAALMMKLLRQSQTSSSATTETATKKTTTTTNIYAFDRKKER
jgi:16S rRNA C967 or C1407 C5-methylase (RsmB/RsmF family)